jgi:VanZ family protein
MYSDKTMNIRIPVALWLATAGYMALIYFLSSRHLQIPSQLPEYFDKIAHVLLYMPLAFLFFSAMKKSGFHKYIFFISILLAGVYGITDEFHQSFVPGRDAASADVAADFVGSIIGSSLACRIKS